MAATVQTVQPSAGISIDEIARQLGVHRTTLYEQCRLGTLPWAFAKVGRRIIVSRKSFESWQLGQSTGKPEAAA